MSNIQTTAANGKSRLSPSQQRFNKLLAQIDKEKQRLREWQDVTRQYRERCANEFSTLVHQIDERQVAIVFLLDQAHADKRLSKRQRAKLEDIVAEMTSELVEHFDDPELKRLYDEYNGTEIDLEADAFDDFDLEDIFGPQDAFTGLGPGSGDSMPEMDTDAKPAAKRRKTARQTAREQVEEKLEHEATQAVREVYRALASALHPDREQDGAERARKNSLMQRVNAAYAQRNLLALLELQLETEQIDQAAINAISEARLQGYNRVLAQQHAELKQEVRDELFMLEMEYCLTPHATRSPAAALRALDAEAGSLRDELAQAESDVALLQEIKGVKKWLSQVEARPVDDIFGDLDELLALADLYGRKG